MRHTRLALYALRAAQPRQIVGRATRPIRRRRIPPATVGRLAPIPELADLWRSPAFAHADTVAGDGAIDVLGLAVPVPTEDWRLPGEPRLRRFHLHYGEEALGWVRQGQPAVARATMLAWLAANPPAASDPWHPYVVSQRLGNWIAAATLEPDVVTPDLATSALRQARYLARTIEDDVLGNHVIANGRALVLAGRALGQRALLERGLRVLRREVPAQVLGDGGHYERSPLYHLLVLRDLLEVRVATGVAWLDRPIEAMQRFAAALRRPDLSPVPFNDAPLELAPVLDLPDAGDGTFVFEETGYTVLRGPGIWLAFDCGTPCPPFLPPHAHADVLSFQLWLGGEELVLDPGTSTYEPGATRDEERSTRAHATVAVDERDQFTLWGAFRSGPLPRVRRLGDLFGEVAYDGVVHRRQIEVGADVEIADEVVGGSAVVARLPLTRMLDDLAADLWETGSAAVRLYERREVPVAVRRGRSGVWRFRRPATL